MDAGTTSESTTDAKRSRAGLWAFSRVTLGQFYVLQVTQFVLLSLWLRYVGAESIGLAAGFTAASGIVTAILDGGLAAYLVPLKEVSEDIWRKLCGQQLLLGITTGLLLCVGAWVAGWFTQANLSASDSAQTEIDYVYYGLGLSLPFVALSRLRLQLMFREFEAGALAGVRWVGLLSRYGLATAFVMISGESTSLLVASAIAFGLEHSFAWAAFPAVRKTVYSVSGFHAPDIVRVRWQAGLETVAAAFRQNSDILILGLVLSREVLGAYVYVSRLLFQLRDAVLSPLSSISMLGFAVRGTTLDGDSTAKPDVGTAYLLQVQILGAFLAPGILLASVTLAWLLPSYDPTWDLSPLQTTLIGGSLSISVIGYMSGSLLYGIGKVSQLMAWSVGWTLAYMLAYASILIFELSSALLVVFAIWLLGVVALYYFLLRPLGIFGAAAYTAVVSPTVIGTLLIVGIGVLGSALAAPVVGASLQAAAALSWIAWGLWHYRRLLQEMSWALLTGKMYSTP